MQIRAILTTGLPGPREVESENGIKGARPSPEVEPEVVLEVHLVVSTDVANPSG
jgi:hypothetical protein